MCITTTAILKLTEIKNFEVKEGIILQDGKCIRHDADTNIYYVRKGTKVYVCYDVNEPFEPDVTCLTKFFPFMFGTLQPFAARDYSKG